MSGFTYELGAGRDQELKDQGTWTPLHEWIAQHDDAEEADANMRTRQLRTCMNIGEMALIVPCQRPS